VNDTVDRLLRQVIHRYADRNAVVCGADSLTYVQLGRRAERLAAVLVDSGLRPGDRLATMTSDRIEVFEIFVAAMLGGFTLVPVNSKLQPMEVGHILADSEPAALIYTSDLSAVLAEAGPLPPIVLAIGPGDRLPGAIGYADELLAASDADPSIASSWSAEDIAVIGYTSGTTGAPKGALCSHRAIVTCTRLVPTVQAITPYGSCVFPATMSFVSVYWGVLLPVLYTGGTFHLLSGTDFDGWLGALAATRATYTWAPTPWVPQLAAALRDTPELLDHLQTIVHTGGAVTRDSLAELVAAAGSLVVETWGMTETIGPVTASTKGDWAADCSAGDVYASAGRAVATAEVAVLDAAGQSCPTGETGQLAVRGDTMFSGYLGQDPHDSDEWFRTGDLGHRDAGGYVYLTARVAELIVSGGMNIYPAEVELALALVPGVREVVVFAAPHPRWGETVIAAVVREPGATVTAEDVWQGARRLAGYKKPTAVTFVDELPRTASGKVQRHVLRDQYIAEPRPPSTLSAAPLR
jgi:acyl-CoA synthetase (AMP-forming)/AMP-acid ligase II